MFWNWLLEHWVSFIGIWSSALGKAGEILGVFSSWRGLRSEKARKLGEITKAHREVWEKVRSMPASRAMFDRDRDVTLNPSTPEEIFCVSLILNHFAWAFMEHRAGQFDLPGGIKEDLRNFFSYPVRREAWQKLRQNYDKRTVAFIERVSGGQTTRREGATLPRGEASAESR